MKNYYNMFKKLKPKTPVLLVLMFVTFLLALAKFICALIYEYLLNSISGNILKETYYYMFIAAILIIMSGFAYYFFIYIRRVIKQETLYKIQKSELDNLSESNLRTCENMDEGEWLNKLTDDADYISDFVPNSIMTAILGILEFSFAIIYGLNKSIVLTVIILIATFASFIIPVKLMPIIEKSRLTKQEDGSKLKSFLLDIIGNNSLVKIYCAKDRFLKSFKNLYSSFSKSCIENTKINYKLNSLNVSIGFLMNAIWMSFGIYLIFTKQISLGIFVGFITLSSYFNFPFFELSYILGDLANQKASYDRLFQKDNNYKKISVPEYTDDSFELVCENMKFGYDDKVIFNKFFMNIKKGSKILINAPSGKGKTTLIKILMGLYKPSEGNVYIITDKLKVENENIRNYCSYIPQGYSLFTGSIRDNLLYGNESATEEELYKILEYCCADEFIAELPKGLDTIIGEGQEIQLSVGQAQRIALARGLLKKSLIYFMDEITSGIDSVNEDRILNNLKNSPLTIVFISHKKNTATICDKVYSI